MRLARGRILWSCSAHSSADRAARPAECALCIPRLGGLPGIPKLLRLCGLPFFFLLCRCRSPSSAAMLRSLLLAAAALPTVLSLAFDLDPSGVKCIGDDVSKDVLIKGDFRVEVSCASAVGQSLWFSGLEDKPIIIYAADLDHDAGWRPYLKVGANREGYKG